MMSFRASLLASLGCSFQASITADYQEVLYTFKLQCQSDDQGNIMFAVIEPETIAGISGRITAQGGELTFDDQGLAFELLADGQLSPVSAPWVLIKALRGGYVSSCGLEENQLCASIRDSYEYDALKTQIWFDDQDLPGYGEILWDNRKILSVEISNFEIL